MLAGGGVDAGVVVESSRAVGPAPERRGEPVGGAGLPAPLRGMAEGDFAHDPYRPAPGSVLEVLQAEWKGRAVTIYSFVAANGRELVTTAGPGPGAATGGCPIAPDYPVIAVCGSSYSGVGGPTTFSGRVGDGVTSLTAEYRDGSRREATVSNGFFLLMQESLAGAPAVGAPDRLVARDASGAVVGTLSGDDPAVESMFSALP